MGWDQPLRHQPETLALGPTMDGRWRIVSATSEHGVVATSSEFGIGPSGVYRREKVVMWKGKWEQLDNGWMRLYFSCMAI